MPITEIVAYQNEQAELLRYYFGTGIHVAVGRFAIGVGNLLIIDPVQLMRAIQSV